jgi:membrane associated rhomboid family serine protease
MRTPESSRWWRPCGWTLGISALVLLLNLGLFSWGPWDAKEWLVGLQFDGVAIREGEWWRLLTGNLVHWSPEHFALDGLAFLALGLLYERYFGRLYPLGVGIAGLLFWDERTLCRGLSGVNGGQFAAALCVEFVLSWRSPRRWLWVAPATAIFLFWLIYESVTGRFFAGALFLSGAARPAPLAHAAGAVAAVGFIVAAAVSRHWPLDHGRVVCPRTTKGRGPPLSIH